jgi:hypothetical protein
MTKTQHTNRAEQMVEANNCRECFADSIEWCNRGGDWFYRNEMLRALHVRRWNENSHTRDGVSA